MFDQLIPHKTPTFVQRLFPHYEWKLNTHAANAIALTFDDGPVPEHTPFVLEILKTYDLTATFFCVGANIEKNPRVYEALLEAGHAVGNHTHNHLKGHQVFPGTYVDNIARCRETMERFVPGSSRAGLFRPPYGRITKAEAKLLKKDFRIIMWDVLTHDYNAKLSSERVLQRSVKATSNGSIVVFHDSPKSRAHLDAVLRPYIDRCLEKGYRFTTL